MATLNGEFLEGLADSAGAPWAAKPFVLYLPGTTTPAPAFVSSSSVTAAANPGVTDAAGNARLYVAPGRYDLMFNATTVADVVVHPAPADVAANTAAVAAETARAVAVDAVKAFATVGFAGFDERTVPTFTRLAGNPVFAAAAQNPATGKTPSTSIYWPYVVNVGAIPGLTEIDAWYLYYTTDHDAGLGGVYLATGPSPVGPWTSQGQVYVDNTGASNQTENASVVYNDDEGLFFMFYKVFSAAGEVGNMVTALATSPDGVAWTRVGIVLDVPALLMFPGFPQTSYVRPFRVGRQWHMHHMIGGGNFPYFALSHSADGRVWQTEGNPLMHGCDQIVDSPLATLQVAQNGLRVEWNSGDVVLWRGQLWWIGIISNFTSGAVPKNARLAVAPIDSTFRHLIGRPQYILMPPTGANESYNYRAVQSHVYQGLIYLTYQCDQNFNVAVSN